MEMSNLQVGDIFERRGISVRKIVHIYQKGDTDYVDYYRYIFDSKTSKYVHDSVYRATIEFFRRNFEKNKVSKLRQIILESKLEEKEVKENGK